eukprot:1025790-Rhodomonas_salina.1
MPPFLRSPCSLKRAAVSGAQAVECDVSGAETLCIEQAIEAVMAAARMASRPFFPSFLLLRHV